ncbi:aldo/keto reductase [Citrobacter sp. JGM124]|uniref:aldo/keto reductase n=1 Tax=Citrobacter sp. JGM124 TaxID=2799789 RepID=UPI001BAB43B0|nr:aldo/keto reductase [Citrobacter sp. JGM124]MBS0847821.1 aldo/keto reductase [Citrobacter sp. JGM124]
MLLRRLGQTGLSIPPLVFGGNIFGWTVDEQQSRNLLDALLERGFNTIDTADVYSSWVDGNIGGESETILGRWFAAHPGIRDKVVLFTKVGSDMGSPEKKGLSERWIIKAVEDSLRRLQTDYIDLYFSHWPDDTVPYEETLGAYQKLLSAGKIRAIGASNLNETQLAQSLESAKAANLPHYQVLQPEYNLYDRQGFPAPLRELCLQQDIGVVTYFSLASGFLSGKYRSENDLSKSARGAGLKHYLTPRGQKILTALDSVAAAHQAQPAEIALAWLQCQPDVTAPIASGTTLQHIESFVRASALTLSADDLTMLNTASQP